MPTHFSAAELEVITAEDRAAQAEAARRMASSSADHRVIAHAPPGMDPEAVLEANWVEVCGSFDGMGLREELMRGLHGYGFENPCAVQQRAIVPMMGVPSAWPLPGRDPTLLWSPLAHHTPHWKHSAVVTMVLLVGERLQRYCDRTWDEKEGRWEDDEARAAAALATLAPGFVSPSALHPNLAPLNTADCNLNPLAGLEYALPDELWLVILGMCRFSDLHPAPGRDVDHAPIRDPRQRDVVVQAPGGTEETIAAFCIAVLQNVDVAVRQCQALVLVPTRDIVQVLSWKMTKLGEHMVGLEVMGYVSNNFSPTFAHFPARSRCRLLRGSALRSGPVSAGVARMQMGEN
jgi:hypothetical protein